MCGVKVMEELYSETYIKEAKLTSLKMLQRVVLIAVAVIAILFGLLSAITLSTILVLLVMVIVAGIAIFFVPTLKLSYEYIFVDGQIDFDRILKGERRKTMKRIDMSKVEVIAPENSHNLDAHARINAMDFSSGKKEDKHFMVVYLGEKSLEKIRFTPDEKMIHMMKMKSPSKVKES